MTWLRKLGRLLSTGGLSAIFERGHHHHHDIDHEAVGRHYHQALTCTQRPVDPMALDHESLRRWHDGYRSWYDACVAPLMKETP